jgi:hypothetical protein
MALKRFLKNKQKKVNLVIFSNEQKTFHLKLNHYLFKFLTFFIIFSIFLVFYLTWQNIALKKEKNTLAQYVLELKNYALKNFLESQFSNDSQDEVGDHSPESYIAAQPKKQEDQTTITPEMGTLTLKKQVPVQKEESSQGLVLLDPTRTQLSKTQIIEIMNPKLTWSKNKIKITFVLVNTSKNKSTPLIGAVCGQFVVTNSLGQMKATGYPEGLKLDSSNNPSSEGCLMGEHVKFSRLRPVTFDLPIKFQLNPMGMPPDDWTLQKASLFFLDQASGKTYFIKDIEAKNSNPIK